MIYTEIQSVEKLDYESINRLQILDSFIKESVRINPLDKSELILFLEIAELSLTILASVNPS